MNFESQILEVSLDEIIPNRFQPRLAFDQKAMEELVASIKEHGVIQPLVLRRVENKYEIIAGERRYKAATLAGLEKVPAIVTDLDDNKSAEVALVENIQRKDLTPIEEAKSYKTILDRGYLTQEQLAKRLGIAQSTIANKLRLLNLDNFVQQALLEEKISERHARSLLKVRNNETQKQLLDKVINERLTVRQLDTEISKTESLQQDETPLVDLAPSVEEIKTKAEDLNPVKETPNIDLLLKPENPPIVVPLQSKPENPVTEQTQNKFFNFLEDESANMNMENEDLNVGDISRTSQDSLAIGQSNSSSSVADPFSTPQISDEVVPNTGSMAENLSLPAIDSTNVTPVSLESNEALDKKTLVEVLPVEPTIINPVNATSPISNNIEVLDINSSTSGFKEPDITNLVDPVNQIETLNPNYQPKIDTSNQYDLADAINDIRDKISEINNNGLIVNAEELDLEKIYQIIIKIDK